MVTGTDILVRTQPRIADIPHRVLALSVLIGILVFASCGGGGGGGAQNSNSGPVTYTVGGTIAGLSGSGLVLIDSVGNELTVSARATSFTFPTAIASGSAYGVAVVSQPTNPLQTCVVTGGSGTVGRANVTSVAVTCTTVTYTISGTIAGLSGSGLVLLDNGGNDLTVSAGATSFTFSTAIVSGGTYSVTVLSQPSNPSQTCTVSSGSGTVTSANVTGVAVTCLPLPKGFVGFVATGSMTDFRYGHTATLLNNGQVLIAGGYDGGAVTDSAELYNPATGTFTATASMTSPRYGQTATLLKNGQVLIAGGDDGDSDTDSAELYNPATGTFTATGNMTDSRSEHTATLLNNGQVLIAGGSNDTHSLNTPLASAELYDPATGTFNATGSLTMTTARDGHTATLLNNGQVLIAGGYDGGAGTASAELYDPATRTFSATGRMTTVRIGHTATLLNNGQLLIAGGGNGTGCLSSAEVYDPATGIFTPTGSMTDFRDEQTATLLNNGNVLVAGGVAALSGSPVLASAELYLPATLTPTGLVSITVTPADPTLSVGSTQQFVATGTFSDSSMQNLQSVTWSSSNQAAGTITNDASDHGVALALAAGNSTITASAGSVSGSTVLTVQ